MECAQLQITGGGSTSPATVSFPGTYQSKLKLARFWAKSNVSIGTDPGITIDIYQTLSSYTIPGNELFPWNVWNVLVDYHTIRSFGLFMQWYIGSCTYLLCTNPKIIVSSRCNSICPCTKSFWCNSRPIWSMWWYNVCSLYFGMTLSKLNY